MAEIQLAFKFINRLFLGIWGLTIIDLIPIFNIEIFNSLDGWIKTSMALLGAIYFLIQLPFKVISLINKSKVDKLDRQIKIEQLEKIERENNKEDE